MKVVKLCPYCGDMPVSITRPQYITIVERAVLPGEIVCYSCGASSPSLSAWNRRDKGGLS